MNVRTERATMATLSPTLTAVVTARGSLTLLRSGRAFPLNDLEARKLAHVLTNGRTDDVDRDR